MEISEDQGNVLLAGDLFVRGFEAELLDVVGEGDGAVAGLVDVSGSEPVVFDAGFFDGLHLRLEGGVADLCVFDPDAEWAVTPDQLRSQSKHSPFDAATSGTRLPGRVRHTLVAGTVAYAASAPSAANAE